MSSLRRVLSQLSLRRRIGALAGYLQIVSILLALAAVFYIARPEDSQPVSVASLAPEATAESIDQRLLTRVDVMRPLPVTVPLTVHATGTVEVRSYLDLTTEVAGRIAWVSPALRDGGVFAAEEELLTLDPTDFSLALAQAQADVASARANLLLEQAQSNAAIQNYALLHKGAAVPPLVAREPQIRQAQAALDAALAREKIATTNLERTHFSLPYAGRVVSSSADVGQVINRATSFGRAYANESVEAAFAVPADEVSRLQPVAGREVAIRSRNHTEMATAERLSAELQRVSRFATVYVPVSDIDALPPGSFVTAAIAGREVNNAYVLPERVEQVGGVVWIVSDGALEQVVLDIHSRTAEGLIVSAFDVGEGIVLGAVPGAYEGLPVRASEDPQYAPPGVAGDQDMPVVAGSAE